MGEPNGRLDGFSVSKDRSEEYMAESEADLDEPKEMQVSAETSRLLELANTIQAQVTQIQEYLTKTKQPNPRFEATEPLVNWKGIDDTRSDCIEALAQLTDMLMTPRETLHSQAVCWSHCAPKASNKADMCLSLPIWPQDTPSTASRSTVPSHWKAHAATRTSPGLLCCLSRHSDGSYDMR